MYRGPFLLNNENFRSAYAGRRTSYKKSDVAYLCSQAEDELTVYALYSFDFDYAYNEFILVRKLHKE